MTKEIEKIIDSIIQGIPKDRREIWAQVFEEKVVGKARVPMVDLEPLRIDAECFGKLEGFFQIEVERSHAHKEGVFVAPPTFGGANRDEARNKTFAVPINDGRCVSLLVQLKEALKPTY